MKEYFVGSPSVGQDCVVDHFVIGELTKPESLGLKEAHNRGREQKVDGE
jgi:hypothetical protein